MVQARAIVTYDDAMVLWIRPQVGDELAPDCNEKLVGIIVPLDDVYANHPEQTEDPKR